MKDNQNTHQSIADSVMHDIQENNIRMRPKIFFIAASLILTISLCILLVLSGFILNIILYRFRLFRYTDTFTFGGQGILPFLYSFPWLLVILTILGIFISIRLIQKYEFAYKYNFYMILSAIMIATIGSFIIFNRINTPQDLNQGTPTVRLYQPPLVGKYWVIGTVEAINTDTITVVTTTGISTTISTNTVLNQPRSNLKIGDNVRVYGRQSEDLFIGRSIRILPK